MEVKRKKNLLARTIESIKRGGDNNLSWDMKAKGDNNTYYYQDNKYYQSFPKKKKRNITEETKRVIEKIIYEDNTDRYQKACLNKIEKDVFRDEVQMLSDEINKIKEQSSKIKEKVFVFIKLIRKYAKKLSQLGTLFSTSIKGENSKVDENLIQTIEQFYQMIYNPKLGEALFDVGTKSEINTIDEEFMESTQEIKELISKYETKIKILVNENKSAKSEIDVINKAIKEKEDNLSTFATKVEKLEQEKINLAETINKQKKLLDNYNDLKNQVTCLSNEIVCKDNVIKNLENLIKNTTVRTSKNDMEKDYVNISTGKINNEKNDENKTNDDMNINNYLNKSNYSSFKEINNEDLKPYENDMVNTHTASFTNRPQQIIKEIDVLDQEIAGLRNQLKTMLNKQ